MDQATANAIAEVFSDFVVSRAKTRGIPRKKLVNSVYRFCITMGYKEAALVWKHADTDQHLKQWLTRQKQPVTPSELQEFLDAFQKIPGQLRREFKKALSTLTALKGGKPRALTPAQTLEARRRVEELRKEGSLEKAYEQTAEELGVSAHTIRRTYDSEEAKRSHSKKPTAMIYEESRR